MPMLVFFVISEAAVDYGVLATLTQTEILFADLSFVVELIERLKFYHL